MSAVVRSKPIAIQFRARRLAAELFASAKLVDNCLSCRWTPVGRNISITYFLRKKKLNRISNFLQWRRCGKQIKMIRIVIPPVKMMTMILLPTATAIKISLAHRQCFRDYYFWIEMQKRQAKLYLQRSNKDGVTSHRRT